MVEAVGIKGVHDDVNHVGSAASGTGQHYSRLELN